MKKSRFMLGLAAILGSSLVIAACGTSTPAPSEPAAATEAVTYVQHDPSKVFSTLGAMPIPEDNPMTPEKIELGKMLYFDPRLSGDDTISCASCHEPAKGWSDNRRTFLGFQGHVGARNSPTIINSGFYSLQFWDGRMKTLEQQALGPIQDKGEMNLSLEELIVKLNAVPEYVDRFQQVFGTEITTDGVAKAIAAFERTIVIDDTDFDKYLKGNKSAMSADAIAGMELFAGKAGCIACHNGPSLSDNNFHNVGVVSEDKGRFGFTGNPEDNGKFKTPQLRGIGHTAPYMHAGQLATLEDVVDFFNKGGDAHSNKSVLIQPLNLTATEKSNLVAFLNALTGELPIVEAPELP